MELIKKFIGYVLKWEKLKYKTTNSYSILNKPIIQWKSLGQLLNRKNPNIILGQFLLSWITVFVSFYDSISIEIFLDLNVLFLMFVTVYLIFPNIVFVIFISSDRFYCPRYWRQRCQRWVSHSMSCSCCHFGIFFYRIPLSYVGNEYFLKMYKVSE